MRADNQRMLAAEVFDELARLDHLNGVYADSRLVEDEDVRLVDDRLRHAHALTEAFGQLADDGVAVIFEAAEAYHVVRPRANPVGGHAAQPAHVAEILADGHLGVERHRLRQIANVPPRLQRFVDDVAPRHRRRPACGRQKPGDDLHGGGLARAVRSEKADNLALLDREANVGDGGKVPEVFGYAIHFNHMKTAHPPARLRRTRRRFFPISRRKIRPPPPVGFRRPRASPRKNLVDSK